LASSFVVRVVLFPRLKHPRLHIFLAVGLDESVDDGPTNADVLPTLGAPYAILPLNFVKPFG